MRHLILLYSIVTLFATGGVGTLRAEPLADTSQQQLTDAEKAARITTMVDGFKGKFKTPFITVEEAVKESKNESGTTTPTVFVDVRTADEQSVSMIEGAITQSTFEKNAEKYRKHKIIAYCTIGYRSAAFSEKIRQKGFDSASMSGSILSWVHAGRTVVDKKGPTRRVHVAGKSWDLLPKGYEAVYP